MREIKFRVFDDFSKKMYYDPELKINKEYGDLWWYWENGGCRNLGNHPHSHIMMFTGLKDRTGRKIFEGDVVKLHGRKTGVVEWFEEWCGFYLSVETNPLGYWLPEKYKVIGNIYENPELLDQENAGQGG